MNEVWDEIDFFVCIQTLKISTGPIMFYLFRMLNQDPIHFIGNT